MLDKNAKERLLDEVFDHYTEGFLKNKDAPIDVPAHIKSRKQRFEYIINDDDLVRWFIAYLLRQLYFYRLE